MLQVAEFLSAAERVAGGGSALDPKVVASLVSARGEDDPLADLTEREREVLELMAQGLTNAGIAKRFYLSERTVEAHVRHVLTKLNIPEGGGPPPRPRRPHPPKRNTEPLTQRRLGVPSA